MTPNPYLYALGSILGVYPPMNDMEIEQVLNQAFFEMDEADFKVFSQKLMDSAQKL